MEDDNRLGVHMASFFTTAGYDAFCVTDPNSLVDAAETKQPEVILIKMSLPHMSGTVAASMLSTTPGTRGIPVIVYDDSGLHRAEEKYPNVERFVPSRSPVELLKAIAAVIGTNHAP